MVLRTSIENGATMNLDLELLSTNIGWVRSFLPIFTLPSSNILIKFPYKWRRRKKRIAQQQTFEIQPIQIPIRLDIMTNDQETSQNVGVGKAT